MIKEMRLRGINTIKEANKFLKYYLSVYAKRFAVKPANDTDLHRPIPAGMDLDKILCVKTKHALRNDFIIAHNGKLYQNVVVTVDITGIQPCRRSMVGVEDR
ncbi:MAG: hypothetical protein QMD92_04565, partial [bacterium]|nr:hypothetical protein [bacterium]